MELSRVLGREKQGEWGGKEGREFSFFRPRHSLSCTFFRFSLESKEFEREAIRSNHLSSLRSSTPPPFFSPLLAWGVASLSPAAAERVDAGLGRQRVSRRSFSLDRCVFLSIKKGCPSRRRPRTSKTPFLRRERALLIVLGRSRALIALFTDPKAPPEAAILSRNETLSTLASTRVHLIPSPPPKETSFGTSFPHEGRLKEAFSRASRGICE